MKRFIQLTKPKSSKLFLSLLIILLFLFFLLTLHSRNKANQNLQEIETTPVSSSKEIPTEIKEKTCGGFLGISCPTGYACQRNNDRRDAIGTCIK